MTQIMERLRPTIAKSAALLFILIGAGCQGPQLARYDETTYQQLTFTKPEVLALYDTFTSNPLDEPRISGMDIKLSQIREYVAGKGPGNTEMTHQVEAIQGMFKKHVGERRRDGPWNSANLDNHKENIGEAFDTAIKTEQAKNR